MKPSNENQSLIFSLRETIKILFNANNIFTLLIATIHQLMPYIWYFLDDFKRFTCINRIHNKVCNIFSQINPFQAKQINVFYDLDLMFVNIFYNRKSIKIRCKNDWKNIRKTT